MVSLYWLHNVELGARRTELVCESKIYFPFQHSCNQSISGTLFQDQQYVQTVKLHTQVFVNPSLTHYSLYPKLMASNSNSFIR